MWDIAFMRTVAHASKILPKNSRSGHVGNTLVKKRDGNHETVARGPDGNIARKASKSRDPGSSSHMNLSVTQYDACVDSEKRVTFRGATVEFFRVRENRAGSILLKPCMRNLPSARGIRK